MIGISVGHGKRLWVTPEMLLVLCAVITCAIGFIFGLGVVMLLSYGVL